MKCEICGAEALAGERKCRYCGNELPVEEPVIDTPQPVEKEPDPNQVKRYEPEPEERPVYNHLPVQKSDVVLNRNNIRRAVFCSKCGRPLDGRTGKCVVCERDSFRRSVYMNNNKMRESGERQMAGGNRKRKKKGHTVGVLVLSVFGIMVVFAIAVVGAFYMMGGFEHGEETESPSPEIAAGVTDTETKISNDDTPSVTDVPRIETATEAPARATASPTAAATASVSSPSMEPKKGDPAGFKGGSYIYPSHKQVIPESALESHASSKKEARLLYYELFARYGMEFDDDDLIEYFEGQTWYTPDGGSSESNIKSQFNGVEKENERIIREYMKKNDWD